jgi:mitogen-activated protein kinase 1/3
MDDVEIVSALGTTFELPKRYRFQRAIGQGAYGSVWYGAAKSLLMQSSAVDETFKDRVAIKKITGVFENVVDCKRTLRELQILRNLKHDNVGVFKPHP